MKLFNLFNKSPQFIPILKEYFSHHGRGLKDSTIEKHLFYFQNIERFLNENYPDIRIGDIRVKHMEHFRTYILETKACKIGHASRHIEHCKSAFEYAILMEYHDRNPISAIACQREKLKEPVSLTEAEIKKIMAHNFTSSNWQLTVDLFLFQSFTGLSFIDLWLYKVEVERMGDQVYKWVTGPDGRGKNNKPYHSELNEYAEAIHNKYDGKFPKITNQFYNRTIKKIAFALNISKDLSSHNARKTYATLRWIQGRSLDSIADELGNSPEMTRKRYITPGRERVRNESIRLRDVPLFKKMIPLST